MPTQCHVILTQETKHCGTQPNLYSRVSAGQQSFLSCCQKLECYSDVCSVHEGKRLTPTLRRFACQLVWKSNKRSLPKCSGYVKCAQLANIFTQISPGNWKRVLANSIWGKALIWGSKRMKERTNYLQFLSFYLQTIIQEGSGRNWLMKNTANSYYEQNFSSSFLPFYVSLPCCWAK